MTQIGSGRADAALGWRDLTSFWGKARPPSGRPSPSYHPLIFHSLDVVAVGQSLLARWPDLAGRLATALGLEVEAATALLVRLLALHDPGKFARRFQAKSPAHCDPSFGSLDHVSTDYGHASGGYALMQSDLDLREGLPEWAGLARLAAAATGHHGTPPRLLSDLRAIFHRHGTTAAHAFAGMLAALLPSGFIISIRRGVRKPCAVLAYGREQAGRAIYEAGAIPAASAPLRTFAELTWLDFEPSLIRRWAAEVSLRKDSLPRPRN